ncbi:DivIVA domain-containing protein [Peterkaempfera bronchialis]|uniref:DivIVA domain-containing protein n=1 Tax=Peterkaempfera bronchialis TaxID=2126346 RepID=A0A345SZZ2_9ACTN|nr:DivIVA domain-containing protein [Peterkaempfera bronchialis]AXI79297.1 DivIVA domain-containing protein [Peterkaempfera bronchialis]
MFWLIVVGMAVVVAVAALVALGAGGAMPDAAPDRLAPRLPQERPLNRSDIDELRLPMALRGYRMDEVDDVLDRLGAELALRDARIAELEAAAAGSRAGHTLTLDKDRPGDHLHEGHPHEDHQHRDHQHQDHPHEDHPYGTPQDASALPTPGEEGRG